MNLQHTADSIFDQKKTTLREAQYNRDNELWETNRMLTSGVVQRNEVDNDFEEEQEVRIKLKKTTSMNIRKAFKYIFRYRYESTSLYAT
jgi:hypothetical protein